MPFFVLPKFLMNKQKEFSHSFTAWIDAVFFRYLGQLLAAGFRVDLKESISH